MEVKVFVDGVPRVVCGVTRETTCQEVVLALAQAQGTYSRSLRADPPHAKTWPGCLLFQVSRADTSSGRNSKTSSGAWRLTNALWRPWRSTASKPRRSSSRFRAAGPPFGMKWGEERAGISPVPQWEGKKWELRWGGAADPWFYTAKVCRCCHVTDRKPSRSRATRRDPKGSLWRSWKKPRSGWKA